MSGDELDRTADAALIKIHAMTGWHFPDPASAEILKDQFQKKMQESYANVNAEEMEYAFRTYGTTVKDWGKSMNLSLIDEVMIPYMDLRFAVSRLEETKQFKEIEHKEDLSDKAMQDWYSDVSKKLIEGMDLQMLPVMLYDWLDKKGTFELDSKTKWAYIEKAKKMLIEQEIEPDAEKQKNLAKRIVLNNYIWNEHNKGKEQ
jgi:hypothetical protein